MREGEELVAGIGVQHCMPIGGTSYARGAEDAETPGSAGRSVLRQPSGCRFRIADNTACRIDGLPLS